MAKVKLTDVYIRNLATPEKTRIEITDETRPGLRIRKSPTGRVTWMYEKRVKGGEKRKHNFGEYPHVSIKHARKLALEIQLEADAGIDRVEEREERKRREEEEKRNAVLLEDVLATYYELHARNKKTGDEIMRTLWAALDDHRKRPSSEITSYMLQAAIDRKALTAPIRANRMHAHLGHFAKFARARGHFGPGVGDGLQKAVKEKPRERELTLDEVRRIYNATFGLDDLWGPLIRLLVLTAQRREEVGALVWSEVDLNTRLLNLGGSRTKNGAGHVTHLSDPAMEEMEWLAASADEDAEFVFSTTGDTPVSGFSKVKQRLDELLGESFEPWRLHDLRTGFATVMAEAGEDEAVVDRVLNHKAVGSAPSAVARIYNRAKKLRERQRVLDRWGRLVTEKTGEVVKIA